MGYVVGRWLGLGLGGAIVFCVVFNAIVPSRVRLLWVLGVCVVGIAIWVFCFREPGATATDASRPEFSPPKEIPPTLPVRTPERRWSPSVRRRFVLKCKGYGSTDAECRCLLRVYQRHYPESDMERSFESVRDTDRGWEEKAGAKCHGPGWQ
jgi:hypothetical protein